MSTTANIIVKVRKEDIGRFRKCDPTKLHLRTIADVEKNASLIYPGDKFEDERKERIEYMLKYDPLPTVEEMLDITKRVKLPEYLEIYHNWDGYPSSLGKELKKNYGTYDLALNLALAGDFSTILEGSMPYAGCKRFNYDQLTKNLWWRSCMPTKCKFVADCTTNYQYYFDGEKWWYRAMGEKEFNLL